MAQPPALTRRGGAPRHPIPGQPADNKHPARRRQHPGQGLRQAGFALGVLVNGRHRHDQLQIGAQLLVRFVVLRRHAERIARLHLAHHGGVVGQSVLALAAAAHLRLKAHLGGVDRLLNLHRQGAHGVIGGPFKGESVFHFAARQARVVIFQLHFLRSGGKAHPDPLAVWAGFEIQGVEHAVHILAGDVEGFARLAGDAQGYARRQAGFGGEGHAVDDQQAGAVVFGPKVNQHAVHFQLRLGRAVNGALGNDQPYNQQKPPNPAFHAAFLLHPHARRAGVWDESYHNCHRNKNRPCGAAG